MCASITSGSAYAGDFKVAVGAFFSQADTSIGVTNPNTGNNYDLDFESDLSLKERTTLPYFLIGYDFNNRHGIFLDWRSLHRTSTNEYVTKSFQIPDSDYEVQAGARINSTLNIDIIRLGYSYTFYDGEDWDWKTTIGLHVMNFKVGFGGELGYRVNDDSDVIPIKEEEFTDLTAPLPNIGLIADYRLTDEWHFLGHAQVFAVSIEDISGLLLDLGLGVEYKFNEDLGLAASYSYYEINVNYGMQVTDLDAKFRFYGPMATLTYQF
ncbi:hypothetical protein HW45_09020 [Vibrio sp. ER1A]|nr:hypothetical protein HW45_09020 [Vibrio sp. ER1A]